MDAVDNVTWAMTNSTTSSDQKPDPLSVVVPMTIVYALIFLLGVIGNVSTCVVIARNKHMHTATNYYLFSLAVSDLLLLVSGLPPEMYYIWFKTSYTDLDAMCVLQVFAAETSANATVLTITAFTVERYVAICHPFQSHVVSKLSRAVKFVVAIWVLAFLLAAPQAVQYRMTEAKSAVVCTTKDPLLPHVFSISTFVFFLAPMTLITVLYVLIGVKLRRSRGLATCAKTPSVSSGEPARPLAESGRRPNNSQAYVIRMLVAVVVAFFICWAPFHAQRLLAVYAPSDEKNKSKLLDKVYKVLTYVSGILYYLSTTVNPVLYNIMSHKFREAFKSTLARCCGREQYSPRKRAYSVLSRCNNNNHQQVYRAQAEGQPPRPTTASARNQQPPENLNHSYPQYRPRSRVSSNSSQTTLTTSLGRLSLTTEAPRHERTGCSLLRTYPSIGALARLLRQAPPLDSRPSVDSGHSTNSISNSSLQDLEDGEFVVADLAAYMGELNELVVLR